MGLFIQDEQMYIIVEPFANTSQSLSRESAKVFVDTFMKYRTIRDMPRVVGGYSLI